jgi:cell division protein ZapE
VTQDVVALYRHNLEKRGFISDPAQWHAVQRLQRLYQEWSEYKARRSNALKRLLVKPPLPKGVYLWGLVGRGKSFLMDAFYGCVPLVRKRRVHFHHFMREIHRELDELKGTEDPIAEVAARTARRYRLVCFDEFHVADIADAMILGRLFTKLFERGIVMVATSNLAPRDLYKDGLNRALFVPFLKLLEQQCEVVRLEARTDFRLEKLTGVTAWYVPPDAKAEAALDKAWHNLVGHAEGAPHELIVKGRIVKVPKAAMGVARFDFADLCEQPLGASDFIKIALEFHTLIIDRIPVMDQSRRNEAKRFIILVDTMYDHAVKLLASAEASPEELYTGTEGYEANEFKRTASRLFEMRSQSYLGLPHGPRTAENVDLARIVDT